MNITDIRDYIEVHDSGEVFHRRVELRCTRDYFLALPDKKDFLTMVRHTISKWLSPPPGELIAEEIRYTESPADPSVCIQVQQAFDYTLTASPAAPDPGPVLAPKARQLGSSKNTECWMREARDAAASAPATVCVRCSANPSRMNCEECADLKARNTPRPPQPETPADPEPRPGWDRASGGGRWRFLAPQLGRGGSEVVCLDPIQVFSTEKRGAWAAHYGCGPALIISDRFDTAEAAMLWCEEQEAGA